MNGKNTLSEKIAGDITLSPKPGQTIRKWREIFDISQSELARFLKAVDAFDRVKILPLRDPYGPAIKREDQEAIVVSKETAPRAKEINEKRKSQGPTADN